MSSTALKTALRFSRDSLDPEQRQIASHITKHPSSAVWVEMGELGKTLPVLTAVSDLLDRFEIGRVLVIATKRIALDTWHAEIEKFGHLNHLRYSKVLGDEAARKEALSVPADVYIINRENTVWIANEFGADWPFDTVILDEATSFKNPSSKRFKALKKVLHKIDRVIEMTGTPASNGYLNLWAQIYLLDRGERLGRTYTAYRQRFFEPDYMGYNWTLKRGSAEKIQNLISDICLRVEVPNNRKVDFDIEVHPVRLPSEIYEQYLSLERDFLLDIGDGTIVETPSAAALRNKLLQVANGAVYYNDSDDKRRVRVLHREKLDYLEKLVCQISSSVLLAYNFESDRDRILSEAANAVHVSSKQYRQSDWDAGKIDLLVGHPASFGHGLNLQFGGHNAVWFGATWDLELFRQFNRRLPRRGQAKRVKIHIVIAADTIEEDMLARLKDKNSTEQDLFRAIVKSARKRSERVET